MTMGLDLQAAAGGQYKVGDKVRIMTTPPQGDERHQGPCWIEEMDPYAGKVGVVADDDYMNNTYAVKFDNGATFWFLYWWFGPVVDGVFEEPDPVPAPPEPRRRVSNILYGVLDDVTKLEGELEAAYVLNTKAVEELVQAEQKLEVADKQVAGLRQDLELRDMEVANYRSAWVSERERATKNFRAFATEHHRNRLLKWLAPVGWALALLLGGVVAAEKISGTTVDNLLREAIMELSS